MDDRIEQIVREFGVDKCTMRIVREELKKSYSDDQIQQEKELIEKIVMQIAEKITNEEKMKSSGESACIDNNNNGKRNKMQSSQLKASKSKKEKLEGQKERKNKFNEPLICSKVLTEFLGVGECSRPQTVKRIWDYIKENHLQDSVDRRYINCDEKMKKVFAISKLHMFTMNKILAKHLKGRDDCVVN